WGSDFDLSALIFGGPIVYTGRVNRTDDDGQLIYEKIDAPFFKQGKETWTTPESKCTFDEESGLWYDTERKCHQARYTAGKNKGQPKFDKFVTDIPQTKNADLLYQSAGLLVEALLEALLVALVDQWSGKRK
ncbi:hypothetical protein ABFP36_24070, partial [Salmonella enterica subsp. enterica serovar Kentucky]|uniref:hypothetical protein n=1 Tax=Salmonella enterica TaxID=28901 RepID=UPI003F4C9E96